MKQIKPANIFYPLPLLFFVLTGSPNLSGPRIGLTLLSLVLLFLVVGYINYRKSSHNREKLGSVMAALVVLVIAYLASSVSTIFAILVVMWPILFLVKLVLG